MLQWSWMHSQKAGNQNKAKPAVHAAAWTYEAHLPFQAQFSPLNITEGIPGLPMLPESQHLQSSIRRSGMELDTCRSTSQ